MGKDLNLAQQERLSAVTLHDRVYTLYSYIQVYDIKLFLMITR